MRDRFEEWLTPDDLIARAEASQRDWIRCKRKARVSVFYEVLAVAVLIAVVWLLLKF